jgi:hypothetical protein
MTTKTSKTSKTPASKSTKPAAKTSHLRTFMAEREATVKKAAQVEPSKILHLPTQPVKSAPPAKVADQVKAVAPKAKEKAGRKPTVASVAKELILAGKTNEQAFAALAKQFGLTDEKKHYPGWYRSALVREEKKRNGSKASDLLKAKLSKTV